MNLRESFSLEKIPKKLDAIVIGSGIGGLCAAALLSKMDKRVLVLEQHYVAGGFTHTFGRKGYEWDVGVHYLGEVHREGSVLNRLFNYLSEGRLRWQSMAPIYDRICLQEEIFDYEAPLSRWKERMQGYFPKERQAIEEYLDLVRQVGQGARQFFMERALPPLVAKVAGPFLKRKFSNLASKTTLETLQKLTQDPKLIAVLTGQYGDYGLTPARSSFAIHAMVTSHYFNGGSYPVGGSSQIAASLLPTLEKAGGKVLVKANVEEILISKGKAIGVKLTSGETLTAPQVISDAGAFNTFHRLLPKDFKLPKKYTSNFITIRRSLSHLCLYVGLKHTAEDLGLQTSNYWIYPGEDHEESMRCYLADPTSPLPVVYISFPSAKDPEFTQRFPGRSTIEVVSFAPYEWFDQWEETPWHKRGEDYERMKENFSKRLLDVLYHWVPQVKGKIDYYELSTPLSTRHFCHYERGEIYGLEHTPERFKAKWLRPHTPIKDLYLTGQDVVSDGVGGAAMGGVLTASAMTGRNIISEIFKHG